MKKRFTFLLTSITVFIISAQSQNVDSVQASSDDTESVTTVLRGPIYPGCEKFEEDKSALYQCLNKNIKNDIYSFLPTDYSDLDKTIALYISFKIDKNGDVIYVDSQCSDTLDANCDQLKTKMKKSFEGLSQYYTRQKARGKIIQPALNSNMKPGTMKYGIEIKFYPTPKEEPKKNRRKKRKSN